MMLLVVYAVFVWWAALKWRRRLLGFLSAGLGVLGVYFVGRFYLWLGALLGVQRPESFVMMLVPFGGFVGLIGIYIALLPRRSDGCCRKCGYSLGGLEPGLQDGQLVCPECGARHAFAPQQTPVCTQCGGEVKPHGQRDWVCDRCGLHLLHAVHEWSALTKHSPVHDPKSENGEGHAENEQGAKKDETSGVDGSDERDGPGLRALGDQFVGKAQPVKR